ncbi:MAG: hypothetical protein ABSE84_00865 [Isosphaeraceae bacterium]|jgi:hypothetical protein
MLDHPISEDIMGDDQCYIGDDEVFLTWWNLHKIGVGPDGRWQLTKDGSETVGRVMSDLHVGTDYWKTVAWEKVIANSRVGEDGMVHITTVTPDGVHHDRVRPGGPH